MPVYSPCIPCSAAIVAVILLSLFFTTFFCFLHHLSISLLLCICIAVLETKKDRLEHFILNGPTVPSSQESGIPHTYLPDKPGRKFLIHLPDEYKQKFQYYPNTRYSISQGKYYYFYMIAGCNKLGGINFCASSIQELVCI